MTTSLQTWMVAKHQEFAPAGSLRARFAAGAFWSVLGAVISRGFLLAASVVCAWFLGKEGFGALGMIQTTAGMFGIFAGLGLGITATKYVSEFRRQDPMRTGRILALSASAAFLSGSIITVLVILLAPYLAQHVLAAPQLAAPLAIGAGLVFFGALNGAQTGALAGFEAFQTIARVNIYAGVASFPLIVFGVWRGGLRGAIWGSVAALAVNWALNNRALRRECAKANISYQLAGCRRELGMLHRFSLPAFLASILIVSAIWVCNALLVRQPQGYAELGIYAAADKWRLMILFVPTSMFAMVLPVLSNLHGEGDGAGFQKVFRANLQLNAGLALLAAASDRGLRRSHHDDLRQTISRRANRFDSPGILRHRGSFELPSSASRWLPLTRCGGDSRLIYCSSRFSWDLLACSSQSGELWAWRLLTALLTQPRVSGFFCFINKARGIDLVHIDGNQPHLESRRIGTWQ